MQSYKLLFVVVLLSLMTSCSTTEKFTVNVPAGTKIYAPYDNTPCGIADGSNKVNVVVPSDMYCGFVLAQPDGSNVKIPLGINYKHNRHNGTRAALYTGGTLTSIGTGVTLIGAIALIAASSNGDDDVASTFGAMAGAGGAAAGIGVAIGMPAQSRLRQTAYDYNFGYESNQRLIMPMLSNTL